MIRFSARNSLTAEKHPAEKAHPEGCAFSRRVRKRPVRGGAEGSCEKQPRSRALPYLLLALPWALLLLWFLLPICVGIVNLADLAGVAGCAVLLWAICSWPALPQLLKTLWRKRGVRVPLCVIGAIAAALVVWLAVLSGTVIAGMHQPPSEATTVVVLGCQVRGETPSALLDHRIESAADYLLEHPAAVCIVSGGKGSGEDISEAECMRRGLIARGVAPERILTEAESTTTEENLTFSARIIEAQGLSSHILIVSNNFHICRALQLATRAGLTADGLPAACDWYMLPTYVLREAMALVQLRLS